MSALALFGVGVLLRDGGHETLGPICQIVAVTAVVIWLIAVLLNASRA